MTKVLRLMLLAVLLVAAALVAWVVIVAVHPRPARRTPSVFASNATWAAYYRDLAEDARATGNEGSAAEYASLARTYGDLPD